jgi:acetate kinase
MKVLVLNCGSSSVKFQLFDTEDGNRVLGKGLIEKIGSTDSIVNYYPKDKNALREIREVLNHETAIEIMLSLLLHPQHGVISKRDDIQAVGHRVVHGGEEFTGSVLITDAVKAAIQKCIQFAPLHNPHNLKGIQGCETLLPGIPQVAVFDTAFHHTIPAKAFLYGLPYTLYKKLGIRRYGFHGTSHRYVAEKAAESLNRPLSGLRLITCHLGNGASITAVDMGKSVDTSMGFTPLEGVMMGTRCGDIDPAVVPYIMDRENLNTRQIDALMNKNSGLLGLSGTSNDMREVEAEAGRGNEQAQNAIDVYCYRIRKYIGTYLAVMGGADAVVFTGGIGENAVKIRARIIEGLEGLGIRLDPEKNKSSQTVIGDGAIKVLVVPTNEELAIVKDTLALLNGENRDGSSNDRSAAISKPVQKQTRT